MTKSLIEAIFGSYIPVTYSQPIYDEAGTLLDSVDVIPSGLAGCDWTYILGVVAFLVVLYCVLRILGSVINNV